MNKLSTILFNLVVDQDFLDYCATYYPGLEHKFRPGYLSRFDLISGFCDKVVYYTKKFIPSVIIHSVPGHWFLEFDGKYYDGMDFNGVIKISELKYFKLNNNVSYSKDQR